LSTLSFKVHSCFLYYKLTTFIIQSSVTVYTNTWPKTRLPIFTKLQVTNKQTDTYDSETG